MQSCNFQITSRRELGNCQICWYAAATSDVQLSGKNTKNLTKPTSCCAYGANGKKSTGAYDCLVIPGATGSPSTKFLGSKNCGGMEGLVASTDGASTTVCCKILF